MNCSGPGYDNAPGDFDRLYYRAVQIVLISNYATLVLTMDMYSCRQK